MKKTLFIAIAAMVAFGFAGCKIKPKAIVNVVVTDKHGVKQVGQEVCLFTSGNRQAGESFRKPAFKERSEKTNDEGVATFEFSSIDFDLGRKATFYFAIFDAAGNLLDKEPRELRSGQSYEVQLVIR